MKMIKYIKYLEKFDKNQIYTIMISIFQIVPIVWLTNIIYVAKYGEYSIHWNCEYIVNSIFKSNFWYSFGVFSLLLIATGIIEYVILPNFILYYKSKKLSRKHTFHVCQSFYVVSLGSFIYFKSSYRI